MQRLTYLVQPIDSTHPCGKDLRQHIAFDSEYFKLRDLRHQAREKERQQEIDLTLPLPFDLWQKIQVTATQLLASTTKDIEIATWLTEAWLRTQGLAGFSAGLQLLNLLLEQFSLHLHPQTDENFPSLASLQLLFSDNATPVHNAVRNLNITHNPHGPNFKIWQWDYAQRNPEQSELKQELHIAIQATPTEFYQNLNAETESCLEATRALETSLTQLFQDHFKSEINSPLHFTPLLSELERLKATLHPLLPSTTLITAQKNHTTMPVCQPLQRHQALQELLNIADYFALNEPQSPIPALIRRAVEWSKLSLAELLPQLIDNEIELNTAFQRTGVSTTH